MLMPRPPSGRGLQLFIRIWLRKGGRLRFAKGTCILILTAV